VPERAVNRREFLAGSTGAAVTRRAQPTQPGDTLGDQHIKLFLCGDVMTGRGIDQILPHPAPPNLYEPFVRSALTYVQLAERVHGSIERPATFSYVWGDALEEWARQQPHFRIVNLETAATTSEDAWSGKAIHYRMSPGNIETLKAAHIDCCTVANNHVLDWGYVGLRDTRATLNAAGIAMAGAGSDAVEAGRPAVLPMSGGRRLLVFAYGFADSGIPGEWAAASERAGVNLLPGLGTKCTAAIADRVRDFKQGGDVAVLSLHWGGNWGFQVSAEQQNFARRAIDSAGIDLIHGHSSHHVKGIEVHHGKLILYGCGDFLNDYEGIAGYEAFRGDLSLMYFPTLDAATGQLRQLLLAPTTMRRFQVRRAQSRDIDWLESTLNREGRAFGSEVTRPDAHHLALRLS